MKHKMWLFLTLNWAAPVLVWVQNLLLSTSQRAPVGLHCCCSSGNAVDGRKVRSAVTQSEKLPGMLQLGPLWWRPAGVSEDLVYSLKGNGIFPSADGSWKITKAVLGETCRGCRDLRGFGDVCFTVVSRKTIINQHQQTCLYMFIFLFLGESCSFPPLDRAPGGSGRAAAVGRMSIHLSLCAVVG